MVVNKRMEQWTRAAAARKEILDRLVRGEALTEPMVLAIARDHKVSDNFVRAVIPRSNRLDAKVEGQPIRMTRYKKFRIITSRDLAEPETALESIKRKIDAIAAWKK